MSDVAGARRNRGDSGRADHERWACPSGTEAARRDQWAGFGGFNAAVGLKKADVDVTVIDRRNYHLFQPLLYQVATAGLSPAQIAMPDPTHTEAPEECDRADGQGR
ncbi:MAG: hypothetical protein EOS34_27220 [Mesorhizobium sp.]|nr:MAG: hypothetical protein EOS34_27220 [Mesorhizobium sp.]